MDIIYYGELDPYSGVDQYDASLPAVIEELTLLLLMYDVVIVPPEAFFVHRLTLPAFESFAPFARAGRLTTTGDHSLRRPSDLVDRAVALYAQRRPHPKSAADTRGAGALPSRRATVAWHRLECLAALAGRWYDLLPALWTLQRNVGAQVDAFARQILERCSIHPAHPASRLLHAVIDHALQSGVAPSRSTLLAGMVARRDLVLPRDLAEAVLSIQIAYFDLGARAHRFAPSDTTAGSTCRLFPGRFARFLGDGHLAPPDHLASTYDPRASASRIRADWRRAGLDPARLLALDPDSLFEVATSTEWASLRAFLRGDPDADSRDAVAATLARPCDLRDALPHLDNLLRDTARPAPAPWPLVLPSEWQLAVQATLAPVLPTPAASPGFTLDLSTLTMTADTTGAAVLLQEREARLLTLLVIAGEGGLPLADVKQHLFDIDRLDTEPSGARLPEWAPQSIESDSLDRARLVRANVLKTCTNKALEPLDIHVDVTRGKGIWRLVDRTGGPCPVRLEGSLWSLLAPSSPPEPPAGLPPTQAALWAALSSAAPHYVSVPALATHLGKPCDAKGLKQTTGAVTRLDRQLVGAHLPVRVRRIHNGHYALAVAPATPAAPCVPQATPPSPITSLGPSANP